MKPEELMTILETLDIESLNDHLQNEDVYMRDLENQPINKIERIDDDVPLFTIYMNDEPVNTINDQYLYNCGFGFPNN